MSKGCKLPITEEQAFEDLVISIAKWVDYHAGDAELSTKFRKAYHKYKLIKRGKRGTHVKS